MIPLPRSHPSSSQAEPRIKVLGLGGAGINALDRIQLDGIDGAELIAINTDSQSLAGSVAPAKVQLGASTTRGLGAGGDPELGYTAAEEAADELRGVLDGASMVFLCVGLGGGTGSGAAPLIANLARQQHAIVIAFATLPFGFEGRRRMAQAEEALASLTQQADVVICFENDRMGDSVSPRAGIQEAFSAADHTISQSVRALAAILSRRGLIQAGFDEIAATLRAQQPRSLFGFGEADGDNRAHTALERALRNPLMDRGRLLGDAHCVLVHIAGGPSMTLNEVTLLMDELNRHISDHTQIFFSTAVDAKLGGKITVTLLSSLGIGESAAIERPAPRIIQEEAPKRAPAPVRPEPESELLIAEKRAPVQTDASPVQEEPPAVAASATEAAPAAASSRKTSAKPVKTKPVREEKQEQMLFEPVNRGRFEKSEPTIVDGQDLDVPAFMRMNVRVK